MSWCYVKPGLPTDIKHLVKIPGYNYIGIERTNKKGWRRGAAGCKRAPLQSIK